MFRAWAFFVCLLLPIFACGARPLPAPIVSVPSGKWRVQFFNGVVETCQFDKEKVSETEPSRSANGTATAKNGGALIAFEDDRTERWTPVGKRWLVEHWCPSSTYPTGRPVIGVAEEDE